MLLGDLEKPLAGAFSPHIIKTMYINVKIVYSWMSGALVERLPGVLLSSAASSVPPPLDSRRLAPPLLLSGLVCCAAPLLLLLLLLMLLLLLLLTGVALLCVPCRCSAMSRVPALLQPEVGGGLGGPYFYI